MTRTEYGVICDRTRWGSGRALIAIEKTAAWALETAGEICDFIGNHPHVLMERTVTASEWKRVAS